MTLKGVVPVAVAGTVNSNGVRSGVFEATNIVNKRYVTRLTFVNQLISPVNHGASAGNAGLEVFDLGAALMDWRGANIALQVTQNDANITGNLFVGLGTVVAIDAVKTAGNDNNYCAYSAAATGTYGNGNTLTADTRTVTAQEALFDGTSVAGKFFLNFNITLANLTGASTPGITLNGTVELHYDDLGSDL